MRTRGGLWAAAAVLVATMTVAGCASGAAPGDGDATPRATATAAASTPAPAPEATATPALAPDPLASVDTIVVSAAGLSFRQGGSELAALDVAAVPLDDAVSLLTRVLGEPRPDGLEQSHCRPAQTRWGWGAATHIGTPDLYTDEGTLTFTARDATIEAPDGRNVRIETTGGLAVGDPIATLDAETDATVKDDFSPGPERSLGIVYDLDRTEEISGGEWSPHGASVSSTDGTIEAIRSTSTLKDFC
jgi:hypothetical protein